MNHSRRESVQHASLAIFQFTYTKRTFVGLLLQMFQESALLVIAHMISR